MTVLDTTSPKSCLIWLAVCRLDDLLPDRGVCALVGPYQVAIFRLSTGDSLHALSNYDPFSGAYVLSRGIVGSKGGTPKVTSPVYKQGFDLRTGRCLEDPSVSVRTFHVRAIDGRVEVGVVEVGVDDVGVDDVGVDDVGVDDVGADDVGVVEVDRT